MYVSGNYIVEPIGNNEFSYNERIALGSKGKIFVPSLIQGTVADLEEGSEIVFEEIENNKIVSCTGLKHFIQTSLFTTKGNPAKSDKEGEGDSGIPTYIFDNHNHALFFRYNYRLNVSTFERLVVLHIDQHADTKENKNSFKTAHSSPQEAFGFANYACNVGNFLTSAKDAGIIDEIIQVRTNYTLKQLGTLNFELGTNYILDIDMDFREEKTDQEIESDFEIIRKLTDNVCLITIATSPYFMEQKQAIELIKKLVA